MTDIRDASAAKVFISYSRKDMPFADRLEAALKVRGINPLIDRSEIYAFEDWWKRIEALIVQADTIVFVLSPDAASSDVALREVEFAASLNKRFAPVVCRPVADQTVPEALRRLNFIFLDEESDFEQGADRLVEALRTNIEWIRKHTEYSEAARRWAVAGRPGPRGLLLRSPILEDAEQWVAVRPEGAPTPTEDTLDFVKQSRRAATQRRNILTGSLGVGLVLALSLASLASGALVIAERQRNDALIAQSRFLARDANVATAEGNASLGVLLALAALPRDIRNPDRPFVRSAESALANAFANQRERLVIKLSAKGTWHGWTTSPDKKWTLAWADNDIRVLDALSGKDVALLKGDDTPVTSAFFSVDGTRILIGNQDGIARIWDAATGTPVVTLRGHSARIATGEFSADGSRVATASPDKTVRLWDAKTGVQLFVLQGHATDVFRARFSPDGTRLLSLAIGDSARLWDAETGTSITVFQGYHTGVFTPDGTRLVVQSTDQKSPPKLVDASNGSTIVELIGHTSYVNHYPVFSPDGTRLLTCSGDKTAIVWDIASGKPTLTLRGHDDYVGAAVFSPDGSNILTASPDGTARLWDSKTGTSIVVFRGHDKRVFDAQFSPDGKLVLTSGEDFTVRLWRADTGTLIAVLRGHDRGDVSPVIWSMFSADSARVWTGMYDEKTLRMWDVKAASELATDRRRGITALLSPNGQRMVTFNTDSETRTAQLWDGEARRELSLLRHDNIIWQASFSPDGTLLATASLDRTARVWDAATGKQVALLRHEDNVWTVAFSQDGTRLVTGSSDNTARLWDVKTGISGLVLRGHTGEVGSATFSQDGTRALTVSRSYKDHTARIWDAAKGTEIAVLRGHSNSIWEAILSRDATRVVTRSSDGTARLWNATTGAQLAMFGGDSVSGVDISPDGRRVIMLTKEGTRILDSASGSQAALLGKHYASSASFSPDGNTIVTTDFSGASIWNVETGELVRTLREALVNFAIFFPDGQKLLTAGATVAIWDVATGEKLGIIARYDTNDWTRSAALSQDGTRVVLRSIDAAWLLRLPACQNLIDAARSELPRDFSPTERSRHFLEQQRTSSTWMKWYEAVRPWLDFAFPQAGEACGRS
jgi:WD40 repeat protein